MTAATAVGTVGSTTPSAGAPPRGDRATGAPTNDGLRERWSAAFLPTYAPPPLALVSGRGCRVTDVEGRTYLDLYAGIAVSSLGHAHPAVVRAVSEQVGRLAHTSNFFVNLPSLELAERLVALSGLPGAQAFLCNSGTEATEAALKIVRRHGRRADPGGGRLTVVAAEGSFHGRSTGALAVTGNPAKREPFAPLLGPVRFVPWGDVDALADAVDATTAGVVLEPTLGEGGVVPAPPGWLAAAREITSRAGALLVVDEVQSGVGRTGEWFASSGAGDGGTGGRGLAELAPDVVTLAKGLAAGLPVGAVLARGEAARALQPGDHGTTFGGNPVACAAALAVLDTIETEGLLGHVREVGEHLSARLRAVDSSLVESVRGGALWQAVVLREPVAAAVEAACRERGVLVNAVRPDVLRLAPPLVVTSAELDEGVDALTASLQDVAGAP